MVSEADRPEEQRGQSEQAGQPSAAEQAGQAGGANDAAARQAESGSNPADSRAASGGGDLASRLAEAQDRALRAQAELENFRKRARRELEEERRYATLPLLRDLLAVVDNLERAIESAEQHDDNAGLLEGVKMVSRQLADVLKQHHCEQIEAEGAEFDPHLHEAVLHQPTDEFPAGTVSRVTRSGYRLHDRVIRPSQVFVSSGSPPETESS